MREPTDEVQGYVDRTVAEWKLLGDTPPWSRLPEHDRIDYLAPLLAATLRGTIVEPPDGRARTDAIRAAAIHGADRRRQGFTEEEVVHEHYLLRLALWSAARGGASFRMRARAMARADVLFSVLLLATLRGFHDERFRAETGWEHALDDLLSQ